MGAPERGAPFGVMVGLNLLTQTLDRASVVYRLRRRSMIDITYYATTLFTNAGVWVEAWSSTYDFPAPFPSSM